MLIQNATTVRKEWSRFFDKAVREKPVFVKRSRDLLYMLNEENLKTILSSYGFMAKKYNEADGSVTLSLNEVDIVSNGKTYELALDNLAKDLIEYSEEYYADFKYWHTSLNRKIIFRIYCVFFLLVILVK